MTINQAESGRALKINTIDNIELAQKLATYGIFQNSIIIKIHKDDTTCATIKVRVNGVTRALAGQLGKHIKVLTPEGKETTLYKIKNGEKVRISSINSNKRGSRNLDSRLSMLGIESGTEIVIQRALPHMEYIVLIENQRRIRITEAFASLLLGEIGNEKKQFSFAHRNTDFKITEIIANPKISSYLKEIGIETGTLLSLEGIEPGKDIDFDDNGKIYLYALEGYRLKLSEESCNQIHILD